MYKIIALISVLIRRNYMPNLFETLIEKISNNIRGISFVEESIYTIWLNGFCEMILYIVTFNVVRIYYEKGSNPILGSSLYLMFYGIHWCLIWFMSMLEFKKWAILLIVIVYVSVHIIVARHRNISF